MPIVRKRNNVIHDLILAIENGYLISSTHAQEQMKKRDIQFSDIEEMIYRAHREEQKDELTKDYKNWKYAIRGFNDSGLKDLRIIVVFVDPQVVLVTAIDKNKKED